MSYLDNIQLNKINQISLEEGDIRKILNKSDESFVGFGEIYTSLVLSNSIKAWKFHKKMTLNLFILFGKIKFVFFDGKKDFKEIILSSDDLVRITVPPKIWYGFKGMNFDYSMILSFTDLVFDETEIERKDINTIKFDW